MSGMARTVIGGAVNLTPVLDVLIWVVGIGLILVVVFWVGFFLLHAVGSVFNYLSGGGSEFGEGIVFYGVIAIVIALIVLAFTNDIVAFE